MDSWYYVLYIYKLLQDPLLIQQTITYYLLLLKRTRLLHFRQSLVAEKKAFDRTHRRHGQSLSFCSSIYPC